MKTTVDNVVIPAQFEVRVYRNDEDEIVIEQPTWPDEAHVITIRSDNVKLLIWALAALVASSNGPASQ